MSEIAFAGLPRERPSVREMEVEPFDWHSLIPLFVHEVKVAIVEAMEWIGQPLSAAELESILGRRNWALGTVAYHVKTLAEHGVIHATHERAARGARETYYLLSRS